MIPSFLLQKEIISSDAKAVKHKLSFIEKTIKKLAEFISVSYYSFYSSSKFGFFQRIDSRVKVIFMIIMVVLISLTHKLEVLLLILSFIVLLYILSKINLLKAFGKVFFIGFVFGFLISMPASLNIFTKGEKFINLLHFTTEHQWWIYKIPNDISITYEGIYTVFRLTFKVINSVAVVLLIISTTTFENIIKSLSSFKIPAVFLITLTMSYKFIFVLSQTINESYLAMKMRWWSRGTIQDAEKIIAGRIGYLFNKSWERYETVYQAMIARGFDNNVRFYYHEKLKKIDFVFSALFVLFVVSFLIINYYVQNL